MKKMILMLLAALVSAVLTCCTNPAPLKIDTAAVRGRIIGDAERVLLAGGGALLISGGNSGAAVAAMTAQEVRNIPELRRVLGAQVAAKNPAGDVTP